MNAIKHILVAAIALASLTTRTAPAASSYSMNLNSGRTPYYYTGYYDYGPHYMYRSGGYQPYTTPNVYQYGAPYYYSSGSPAYRGYIYTPRFSPGYSSDGYSGAYYY